MEEKNFYYILQNTPHTINIVDWLRKIQEFFGKEQAEAFFDYYIHSEQVKRRYDIRNIMVNNGISVYSCSGKEQIAFLSIYRPINRYEKVIRNIGFEQAQALYRNKDVKFSKSIKKLGYSYSTTLANWLDKTDKDTYQKEYVFIVFSEKNSPEQFKNDMIDLARKYNIKQVLITDKMIDKTPKMVIGSKQYNVADGEIVKETKDTTIETVEKYLSEITNSKVLFNIYEENKVILYNKEPSINSYYSIYKQEFVRKIKPHNHIRGLEKYALVKKFSETDYNN